MKKFFLGKNNLTRVRIFWDDETNGFSFNEKVSIGSPSISQKEECLQSFFCDILIPRGGTYSYAGLGFDAFNATERKGTWKVLCKDTDFVESKKINDILAPFFIGLPCEFKGAISDKIASCFQSNGEAISHVNFIFNKGCFSEIYSNKNTFSMAADICFAAMCSPNGDFTESVIKQILGL